MECSLIYGKREESAPDNYHEKRWFGLDGDKALLFRIWGNMALNPAISFNPAQVLPDLRNPKVGETVEYELGIPDAHIQVTSVVESLTQTATVPAGVFTNCMLVREVTEITVNGLTDYD